VSLDSCAADDIRLLKRIAAGDHAAIGELYDRYSAVMFGVIMRILRSRSDAEEVLQEVFMRVWSRAEMYDDRLGAPAPWLVRIARNRAIDRLRATRSVAVLDEADARDGQPGTDASAMPTPEVLAVTSQTSQTVRSALAVLPPEQRTLIEAAFYEGYTHSELADRFGLPLGTVKTRIRTGMRTLRAWLEHVV
jgi:RNA polymerase sigma-70 factor (ECF subfamily)